MFTRAILLEITGISIGGTNLTLSGRASYVNSVEASSWQTKEINADSAPDASPREVMNAFVAAIIASQPAGYDLRDRDVILLGLDRG